MNSPFFKTTLAALLPLTLAATGCAASAEDEPAPAQEAAAEETESKSDALIIGGGGLGGTSLWCACKLNCDNDYAGMPVLIKACKAKCDTDNKCRKTTGFGGGVVMY